MPARNLMRISAVKKGKPVGKTLFGTPPEDDKPRRVGRMRAGWTKTKTAWPGVWRHDASGWTIHHCGHPTALWPYYGQAPDGSGILITHGFWPTGGTQPNGYAFQRLEQAMIGVETHVASLLTK